MRAAPRWWFPRPRYPLDDATWSARHRALCLLAVAQALVLLLASAIVGYDGRHLAEHGGPLVVALLAGALGGGPRWLRSGLVALALLGSSAVLVHVGDGRETLHFHFFVMLPLLGLYEDARPLVLGVGFVLLHHAVLGTVDPASVFGAGAAPGDVLPWAAVHAAFVLAASVALVVLRRAGEEQRRVAEEATAREHARLEREAMTDALTGCANRRRWAVALAEAQDAARDGRSSLSIVVLDLDDFKGLNDREGHEAGDRHLQAAAAAWSAALRPGTLLARLGGDEFAVLLPGCGAAAATGVAARLRAATPAATGVSAGVAEWDGAEDGATLLRRADEALYADKRAGRTGRLRAAGRVEAARRALARADREQLDELAASVSRLLGVPLALVSLLTDDTQVIPGAVGLPAPLDTVREVGLEHSICAETIVHGRALVVEDARVDPRLQDHVAVRGGAVGAYAGVPLVVEDNAVGVLCAVDARPRAWTADELAALRHAARRTAELLAPGAVLPS